MRVILVALWLSILIITPSWAQQRSGSSSGGATVSGVDGQIQTNQGGALGHQTSIYFGPGSVFSGHTIVGDGVTDDTAGIQAAIDYAASNGIQEIRCGDGVYKITEDSNKVGIYLDPPGNLRSNLANPASFNFSLSLVGATGSGNNNGVGCRLRPNFGDGIGLMVGPGQYMKVANLSIVGTISGCDITTTCYRGNQNIAGVGLGIAGGSGGASVTLIDDVDVENFYTCMAPGANGNNSLADSNTIRKPNWANCYYGFRPQGTQNDINEIYSPRCQYTTICIDSDLARAVSVFGGNLSGNSGVAASFGISSISSFSGSSLSYTFTGVLASPDAYVARVYNAWIIPTAHFGIVPLTMTNWNSGTNTATFAIDPAWEYTNFGLANLVTGTDIQSEIAAATTIYAAEKVTVAHGLGITMTGVHIENPDACTTLFYSDAGFGGAKSSEIRNPYFNYDPALTSYGPTNSPSAANLARYYCQQSFPFIYVGKGSANTLLLDGGDYGQDSCSNPCSSLIIQVTTQRALTVRRVVGLASPFNLTGLYYGSENVGTEATYETATNGAGEWDGNYFLPTKLVGTDALKTITNGPLTVPHFGYYPAPGAQPTLTPDIYSLVTAGSLGALGTYPPISCRTLYGLPGWSSAAMTAEIARSASCPGYSWGKTLNDAAVGGTVTWSHKGQSSVLFLDANTLGWLASGFSFTLDSGDGNGVQTYLVTGVYPGMTSPYATVIKITGVLANGTLTGTKTSNYSCSSTCSLGQIAFAWSTIGPPAGTSKIQYTDSSGVITGLGLGTNLSIGGNNLNATSSGGLSLVSTQSFNGSVATLEWTGLAGNNYTLRCKGVYAASGIFGLQFGTGGTPTWLTTNYHFSILYANDAGTTGDGGHGTNNNAIRLNGSFQTTAANGDDVIVEFFDLASSITHKISYQDSAYTGSSFYRQNGGGMNESTTAVTAIRVLDTGGGNPSGGTCSLYSYSE